jgi:hypothetical protein
MMSQRPTLALREGAVLNTITLGRVRIKELTRDEVHCVEVGGKAQIVLSRKAALRRVMETEKEAKK